MNRLLLLLTLIFVLALKSVAQVITITDSTKVTYKEVSDSLKKDFNKFTDDLREKQSKYDAKLKEIDSLFKDLGNKTSNSDLNEKLKLVTQRVDLLSKQDSDKLNVKFEICGKAITKMKEGVTIVGLVNDLLELQQQINLVTNIWKDSVIRNGWDKAQSWFSIGGATIAGLSLIPNSQNKDIKSYGIGIGVSIAGLGEIFKKAFGKENIKHFELIQLSRKSFDDLTITQNLLQNFIADNERFDKELTDLKNNYDALEKQVKEGKGNANEQKIFVVNVIEKMNDYNKTLKQIPAYLAQLKGLTSTYSLKYYDNIELKKVLADITDKATKIEDKYNNKVKPLLDLTPEIKTTLLGS